MSTLISGGTVRAKFDDTNADVDVERRLLADALDELQVPGHSQAMVERILEVLPPEADDELRQAARWCVTAVVSGIFRGSTGLPLETDHQGIGLVDELDVLVETVRQLDDERRLDDVDASELLETFRDGLDGPLSSRLVEEDDGYAPLVVDQNALYTHKTAWMERHVARRIASLLSTDPIVDWSDAEDATEAVLGEMPFPVGTEERDEIGDLLQTVLPGRLGVISGGAGSGKTTRVMVVLRVLNRLDEAAGGVDIDDIALAAPTGKAAKRLGEAIDDHLESIESAHVDAFRERLDDPKTLHRLLRYSPYRDRFRRNTDNPLDAELVVVDEASMIGLGLMQALVRALPDDGRLLLVGDAGQLPSVQAGAVFHDLSDKRRADGALDRRICVLEGNHRVSDEGQNIVSAARQIRHNETTAEQLRDDGFARSVERVDQLGGFFFLGDEERETGEILDDWWRAHYSQTDAPEDSGDVSTYRSRTAFDHDEEGRFTEESAAKLEALFERRTAAQLLCITRVGPRGTRAINRHMHREFTSAHGIQGRPPKFAAGEPVIITRNDYEAEVFNGEQGLVLYTRRPEEREAQGNEAAKKRVVIQERDGFRAISFTRLRDKLEHAYALTVHKSQGSEYDHVGLMLPELRETARPDTDGVHPMLTRQILYTAVTRAKTSVVVIGDETAFDRGVERSAGRYSGVGGRLQDLGEEDVTAESTVGHKMGNSW